MNCLKTTVQASHPLVSQWDRRVELKEHPGGDMISAVC